MTNHEYSQGVCEDGAAILKDGEPMTIEEILDELKEARVQEGGEAVAYAAVNGKDRSRIAGLCTTEEMAELNAQRIGGDVRPLVFGDTHPSASVPDRLIEAVKALHIDDDMFGVDFQDEMATYQCQYCSFDMEHYGPSLDAYKLIKHDDDCPITKLRSLLATTPQPADNWLKVIEENCWDLRCTGEPTGGDDYDVIWHVIEHHMAEPKERTLASNLCPIRALELALNPPAEQEGE